MARSDSSRNSRGGFGDDDGEMLRRDRLDERTADAVLSGRGDHVEGDEVADLAMFVTAVQSEAMTAPARPSPKLAEVLVHGIPADHGEAPVTAASNVDGPATQVSAQPKRRIRTMVELLIAKLGALGLAAKAGVAVATVAAATTGAGAAGLLPDALQGSYDTMRGVEQTEDLVPEIESDRPEPDVGDVGVDGPDVADDAREDEPGVDGQEIAEDASDGRSAEGLDRAGEGRENAPELPEEADGGPDLPDEANGGERPELPEQAEDADLPEEAEQREENAARSSEDTPAEGADTSERRDDDGQGERGTSIADDAPEQDTPPVDTPDPDEGDPGSERPERP